MNTPAHLIFAAAAFGKPNQNKIIAAAMIGGFLPDLSLYVMASVSIFILNIEPEMVFDHLYYTDEWQQVFAIDNSFVLWGIGLGVAFWQRSTWAIALCGAALLHIALDFPLHTHDARMHFWPITDWKFHSPVSYWDSDAGANWVGLLENFAVAALAVLLWRRHVGSRWRHAFAFIAILQVFPFVIWTIFF